MRMVVGDDKSAYAPSKIPVQAAFVLQVSNNDLDSSSGKVLGFLAVGISCDSTNTELGVVQEGIHNAAALSFSGTNDDDEFCHGFEFVVCCG